MPCHDRTSLERGSDRKRAALATWLLVKSTLLRYLSFRRELDPREVTPNLWVLFDGVALYEWLRYMLDQRRLQPSSVSTYLQHILAAQDILGGLSVQEEGASPGVKQLVRGLQCFSKQLAQVAELRPPANQLEESLHDYLTREQALPLVMEALQETLNSYPPPGGGQYAGEGDLVHAANAVLDACMACLVFANVVPRRTECLSCILLCRLQPHEQCPHPNCLHPRECPGNFLRLQDSGGADISFNHHKTRGAADAISGGTQVTSLLPGTVEVEVLRRWLSFREALTAGAQDPSPYLFIYPGRGGPVPSEGMAQRVSKWMENVVGVPLRPHKARAMMADWARSRGWSPSQLQDLAEGMGHNPKQLLAYSGRHMQQRLDRSRNLTAMVSAGGSAESHSSPPSLAAGTQLDTPPPPPSPAHSEGEGGGGAGPGVGGGGAPVSKDELVRQARERGLNRRPAHYPRGLPRKYTTDLTGPFLPGQIRGLSKQAKACLIARRWGVTPPTTNKAHAYLDRYLTMT